MTVVAATKIVDDRPDAEELVRRASALVPMLRERADEVEKNRSVPPTSSRASRTPASSASSNPPAGVATR